MATGHPYYDPTGSRHGLPTYPWGWVGDPDLRTKAQLRAEGLSIAGLEVAAQIMWRSNRAGNRNGVRTAALYRRSLARPVRPLTPAQERALARAELARHTCRDCGRVWEFCLPTSNDRCCPDGCATFEAPEADALAVAA
ncbi:MULTISPECIES: RRQRL motif-containing zinc-binding protein [unclassified Nocardiopsis]|uniref:RRQRL motif-containing zinc-binding protein n=1 Tax=unclassified Nocardiopsis TaxID=2649073 RepID=UPI001915C5F7|nr:MULTISPECIES: RRQRL motif-containing zinc-binding protein [unclassified Nocardiopsis]